MSYPLGWQARVPCRESLADTFQRVAGVSSVRNSWLPPFIFRRVRIKAFIAMITIVPALPEYGHADQVPACAPALDRITRNLSPLPTPAIGAKRTAVTADERKRIAPRPSIPGADRRLRLSCDRKRPSVSSHGCTSNPSAIATPCTSSHGIEWQPMTIQIPESSWRRNATPV